MRFYEHTFIARQDLSAQQAQTLAETYAGVVAEQGGEVTKSEYWGIRNLAYRIKKNRKGHYLHFNLRAPAPVIEELERQERLNDDVIRYLTVKVDVLDEKPSIQAQVRSSREERSRRAQEEDRPRRSHDEERPRRSQEEERPRRAQEEERPRRAEDEEQPRGAPDEAERATEAEPAATETTSETSE